MYFSFRYHWESFLAIIIIIIIIIRVFSSKESACSYFMSMFTFCTLICILNFDLENRFCLSFFFYFAIGMLVKWKFYQASGCDLLPNANFWKDFPTLLKVVMSIFLKNVIQNEWERVTCFYCKIEIVFFSRVHIYVQDGLVFALCCGKTPSSSYQSV